MTFNPAAWVIRRWQFALVAVFLMSALGLAALFAIPRTEDPQLNPPQFGVVAVLPGASPRDIEQQITKPLEDAIYKLDSLKEVRSSSSNGFAFTRVEFIWGTNPRSSYDDLVREVDALRPSLPKGLVKLEVQRFRPTFVSIVQVALTSDTLPMRRFEKIGEKLREQIAAIPGIHEAKLWGATPTEARVALDMSKLTALGLTPSAVVDALRNGGAESPIGKIDTGGRRFNVEFGGAYPDLNAISNIAVANHNGAVLHVGDIARVEWAQTEADHITRYNGKRAIILTANQNENQDVTRLSLAISDVLDHYERTLPPSVKLARGFDQSQNVTARIGHLERDFLIALVLVSFTLLPIGLRAASVVIMAIPLSLLFGVLVIYYAGYTLNQLSIAGFIISLGILVDDAIVVTENIARWIREGYSRSEAAIKGTGQIALAVVGCTACLILAFVPLLALPEGPGEFIRSMPVTVFATVSGSFLVAMTVIPLAASWLLRPEDDPEGNRLLIAVNKGIHRFYAPVLHRALARPGRVMIGLLLLSTLAFPLIGVIGTSLFPPAGAAQFLVRIQAPEGSSLDYTDAIVQQVEHRLQTIPDMSWISANTGHGNPSLYYNVNVRESDPTFGEVAVGLKSWETSKGDTLLEQLRHDFAAYKGAKISVIEFVQGPNIEAPIAIRLSGPDLATLTSLANKTEAAMATTPGVRDIGNPLRRERGDLTLDVDDAKVAALGVPAGALRQTLQLALSGVGVANLRDNEGDSFPVSVRLPMNGANHMDALGQIFVPTNSGGSVPLSAIAHPTIESGPAVISRIKRTRDVTLTAEVEHGKLIANVTQDALAHIARDVPLPPGYELSLGGEAESQSRSFAGLLPAIVTASLGILAVLVLEFGKFRTVAVVFGIVPFGFLGAVIALWLTGNSLSFTATVGLIALIGIEIKNSILLVDFTDQLRAQGVPVREAVERAGELRFLPVLLTSVTAIGGLLPLALENNALYSPVAIVLIGGLITSTLLARIATPVMYLLLAAPDAEVTA